MSGVVPVTAVHAALGVTQSAQSHDRYGEQPDAELASA